MPDEFKDKDGLYKTKEIFCNDCEKKSNTEFHFLGSKCKECGSYNTC